MYEIKLVSIIKLAKSISLTGRAEHISRRRLHPVKLLTLFEFRRHRGLPPASTCVKADYITQLNERSTLACIINLPRCRAPLGRFYLGWAEPEEERGGLIVMQRLKIVGLGVIIWALSLSWPEINRVLTEALMLKLILGLGLVIWLYILIQQPEQPSPKQEYHKDLGSFQSHNCQPNCLILNRFASADMLTNFRSLDTCLR